MNEASWSDPGVRHEARRPRAGVTTHLAMSLVALLAAGGLLGGTLVSPATVPAVRAAGPGALTSDAGYAHTCVVLANGTVACWGNNSHVALGVGTDSFRLTPVNVPGISTASAISAGYFTTCALLANRTIRCWGLNDRGQLGDGTNLKRLAPVAVSGITTATAVSTESTHACAVLSNGTVRCWGANDSGQLGNGNTTDRLAPVTVSGITTATAIDAGYDHTCALLSNGTVACWGANDAGQLGNGTTDSSSTPVAVTGITTATAIDAGLNHTCAVLANRTVACWGANPAGELGNGTTDSSSTPVAVTGISTATAVSADRHGTCALLADQSLACWGDNCDGQLGNGTTDSSSTPVAVIGISSATTVSRGGCHTCAVLADQTVRAWGDNRWGQVGDGTTTDRHVPVAVAWLPTASMSSLPRRATSATVPVRWSAAAGTNPVASYDVRYRRAKWNGGFGSRVLWLSATTATSKSHGASPGSTYCYSARARDDQGLLSAWTAETCTAIPLDDRSLARSASWTAKKGSSYYLATFLRSSTRGATLTRTGVVATRISLLATTCRKCGTVKVYWNSALLKKINLRSGTTVKGKLIKVKTFASGRSGTLRIKVSSSGKKVLVDGVSISRN